MENNDLCLLKKRREHLKSLLFKKAKIFIKNGNMEEIEGSAFYLMSKIDFIDFIIANIDKVGGEK